MSETWGDVYGRFRAKGMDASDAAFRADEMERRRRGEPEPRFLHAAPMSNSEFSRHLLIVGSFIAWHDDRDMMGGYRASEAFDALCAILGLSPEGLRAALRPAPDAEDGRP